MLVDVYIIFVGNQETVWKVKDIWDHYCQISSQLANYHKLRIQFSKGIRHAYKREVSGILQISSANTMVTYLCYTNLDRKRNNANF